jgi:hypothetical protein
MIVSFRSEFPDVAATLFIECFPQEGFQQSETTGGGIHFLFVSDRDLLEARGWISNAIGCGLIVMGAVQVES